MTVNDIPDLMTTKQLASSLGVTARSVNRWAKMQGWQFIISNHNEARHSMRMFVVNELPKEVLIKLNYEAPNKVAKPRLPVSDLSKKCVKRYILSCIVYFSSHFGISKVKAQSMFIKRYNSRITNLIDTRCYHYVKSISVPTLERWKREFR